MSLSGRYSYHVQWVCDSLLLVGRELIWIVHQTVIGKNYIGSLVPFVAHFVPPNYKVLGVSMDT